MMALILDYENRNLFREGVDPQTSSLASFIHFDGLTSHNIEDSVWSVGKSTDRRSPGFLPSLPSHIALASCCVSD